MAVGVLTARPPLAVYGDVQQVGWIRCLPPPCAVFCATQLLDLAAQATRPPQPVSPTRTLQGGSGPFGSPAATARQDDFVRASGYGQQIFEAPRAREWGGSPSQSSIPGPPVAESARSAVCNSIVGALSQGPSPLQPAAAVPTELVPGALSLREVPVVWRLSAVPPPAEEDEPSWLVGRTLDPKLLTEACLGIHAAEAALRPPAPGGHPAPPPGTIRCAADPCGLLRSPLWLGSYSESESAGRIGGPPGSASSCIGSGIHADGPHGSQEGRPGPVARSASPLALGAVAVEGGFRAPPFQVASSIPSQASAAVSASLLPADVPHPVAQPAFAVVLREWLAGSLLVMEQHGVRAIWEPSLRLQVSEAEFEHVLALFESMKLRFPCNNVHDLDTLEAVVDASRDALEESQSWVYYTHDNIALFVSSERAAVELPVCGSTPECAAWATWWGWERPSPSHRCRVAAIRDRSGVPAAAASLACGCTLPYRSSRQKGVRRAQYQAASAGRRVRRST